MSVARELAEFLTGVSVADLPAQAMDHATMVIASTFASAAFGTTIASAQIIRDLAREQGGRPDSSIWFDTGAKLPVAQVARVNAMLSDAAASDDSDLRNIVHAGTPLTAVALAMAERLGASGEAVLDAIVIGYEVAGRLSEPITPGFRNRGFHGCLGAAMAAAGAAARMLRLPAEQMAQTIAITAVSIGGLATAADTSVAREYHAGLAAMHGVNAALAAQRGFKVEERILETHQGFFEAFGGVDGAAAGKLALAGMGESWDIVTDMAIKLIPGGHPHHSFAEAAAKAARAGGFAPDDIEAITVSRPGLTKIGGPLHPADLIDMAHSPANFLAAGAADWGFGWVNASPEKIADPVIHRLIDKVRVGTPPTEHAALYRQGATVTITATDGRFARSTVLLPHGSGALGIDWADIDAKYRALMPASGLDAAAIDTSLSSIKDIRKAPNVSALIGHLRT
jgi:2-methylcitrate dehydratase PrpD